MSGAADGTVIRNGNQYMIAKGGEWHPYSPPAPKTAAKSGAGGLTKEDRTALAELSKVAQSAGEAAKLYNRAEGSLNTLKPSPNRGRFLQMMIPEDGGGILDTIGGVVGMVPKAIGAITPEEEEAYSQVRGIQSAAVLERQLPQKGPQTESDAARMQLAEISPSKGRKANAEIMRSGRQKIKRDQAKAVFYTKWANKYGGLTKPNEKGETVDEIWSKAADYITGRVMDGKPRATRSGGGAPTIRVISRRKK